MPSSSWTRGAWLPGGVEGTDAEVQVVLSENEVEVSNSDSFLIDHAVAVAGGITAAHNPTLMNLFYLIGASDRAGSGLYSIWSIWQWVWGAVPILEELHSPVKVRTIMSLVSPKGNDEFENHGAAGQDLSKVIALAKRVTAADVAMAFAVSERMAQKRLIDQSGGRVTRVRDGRAGAAASYWKGRIAFSTTSWRRTSSGGQGKRIVAALLGEVSDELRERLDLCALFSCISLAQAACNQPVTRHPPVFTSRPPKRAMIRHYLRVTSSRRPWTHVRPATPGPAARWKRS